MREAFKVGDKAVYPAHGVGEVTAIENRSIGGIEQTFYILRILENGMKIMVPTDNIRQVGLREVISKSKVEKVLKILKAKSLSVETTTWNRRYREYMEKIKTGSLLQIASVLRDLCILRAGKELSYGEKNMLETARGLLVQELALAKEQTEDDVASEIDQMFES